MPTSKTPSQDAVKADAADQPKRRSKLIATACVAITGLLLGALLSLWQSGRPAIWDATAALANKGWVTDPEIGSDEAGLMLRARIARRGLFALNRSEAIYYTRAVDDMGRPFDEKCSYRIDGGALPAKWWSITIYASDNFLARNGSDAHSINATSPQLAGRGRQWSARLSEAKPGPDQAWLSTKEAGAFDLTLRLYEPDAQTLNSTARIDFPSVKRLSC